MKPDGGSKIDMNKNPRPRHYVLNEHGQPVPCDFETWVDMFERRESRVVRQEEIGPCRVSTVFLGLDHNWSEGGPAILWETMVFGPVMNQEMSRCSGGREQAEAMHQDMVARLEAVLAVSNH